MNVAVSSVGRGSCVTETTVDAVGLGVWFTPFEAGEPCDRTEPACGGCAGAAAGIALKGSARAGHAFRIANKPNARKSCIPLYS
jgi:hypothetical protein